MNTDYNNFILIDTPSETKHLKNIIGAIQNVDAAVLVVDADKKSFAFEE